MSKKIEISEDQIESLCFFRGFMRGMIPIIKQELPESAKESERQYKNLDELIRKYNEQ